MRDQQRLSITSRIALSVAVIIGGFLIGLGVHRVSQPVVGDFTAANVGISIAVLATILAFTRWMFDAPWRRVFYMLALGAAVVSVMIAYYHLDPFSR